MKPLNLSSSLRHALVTDWEPGVHWNYVVQLIDASIKFLVPDLKYLEVRGAGPGKLYVDIVASIGGHLPYPVICVESLHTNDDGETVDLVTIGAEYPDEFLVFSFARTHGVAGWGFCSAGSVAKPIEGIVQLRKIGKFPYLPELNTEQRDLAFLAWDVILDLCTLLACKNVHAREVKATFTERAKAKKRNRPIFNYHILEVGGTRSDGPSRGPAGDREGPRVHLRRGHIRHLSDHHGGGITWVQATVVGTKSGMVHKDYGVRNAQEA